MARQRAPLPLDVERSAQKLSMTPQQVRRVLDGLVAAGQIAKRPNGYHVTVHERRAAAAGKTPGKQPHAKGARPSGQQARSRYGAPDLKLNASERRVINALMANRPTALERPSAQAAVSPRVIASLTVKDIVELRQGRIAPTPAALRTFTGNRPY